MSFLETTVLPNDRFTDSEGLTQMAWQRSDESWSGTLLTKGPASVTFQGVAQEPLWTSTFDVRMADDEGEEEEAEDDDDDDGDEDMDDEDFDGEDLDDDDFDDEEFDDDDDDLDDDDEDEEEDEDEDEDY